MTTNGQLRIIGGKWKRRRIRFPAVPGLRPTPDSVRETLFNWLQRDIAGRKCLDLFAGSGALGFEAVSRGADSAVLLDSNERVAAALRQNVTLLGAQDQMKVLRTDARRFLSSNGESFDLVFIDPPFSGFDLPGLLQAVNNSNRIETNGLIYIESAKTENPLPMPDDWHIIRESQRGMVQSTLITRTASAK